MSSPKLRNQSVEGNGKPEREQPRWSTGKASRLPCHTRSPSASGRKSKIPTNIGHTGRPGAGVHSQVRENPRLLTSVASNEATLDKSSPINTGRGRTSRSVTAAANPPTALNTPKAKSSTTSGGFSSMLKRQLEGQFAMKRKRYGSLKKELTDKQKSASDLYEEMSQLREKLIANGAKDPGKIETINLTGVPPQQCAEEEIIAECHAFQGSGEQVFAPNSAITSEFVSSVEAKLRLVANRCFDLCSELLQKRSAMLQWLVEFAEKNSETKIDTEIAQQVEIYHSESAELEGQLDQRRKTEEEMVNETVQEISELWKEVEASRVRIRELENASEEVMKELHVKVETALSEKKFESERYEQLLERKQTMEAELQKLKSKIRGLEVRATEDESKIAQLQSTVKNLESQLKQKEASGEQRLKDLQKSLKNSESLLAKTEKQRDNFESRVNELKKNLGLKETEAESRIKELSDKLDAVNAQLEKYHQKHKGKTGQAGAGDVEVKKQLAERDEKIETLEREKEDIVRVIQHGLLSEVNGLKLDGDSNSHETLVSALMKKMQDIRMNVKLTQDMNGNLQKQLSELRLRIQTQSKDSGSGKSIWSNQVIELQQQVCDLRCSVAELTRRNEELEIQLNQKQLEIEKQEQAMRAQSTVLKARDEVIELLKGRPDACASCEVGHLPTPKRKNLREREQVDKQIGEKAENLQHLYSTLERKQMQITRLEELVKQMEIQQSRAQEQRTRLEKKIAQLQMAIYYRGKGYRYVKEKSVPPTKVSSAQLDEPSRGQKALQRLAIPSNLHDSPCQPRSCSRPPPSRPPPRHPQIQRSKTLNSIQLKSKTALSKEYATQVMDEVARTLRRERAYDLQKRGLGEGRQYSREGRGVAHAEKNLLDAPKISKDEIHESFYNWLVEPWMFEGEPSNLAHPRSSPCQNHRSRAYATSSEISVSVTRDDPESRRHRAANDCSRESRCGSPECLRRSAPDWDCSASPTRARTSPQESTGPRSRRQRSKGFSIL